MHVLTRALNISCSSTSLNCLKKKINILVNSTSHKELASRRFFNPSLNRTLSVGGLFPKGFRRQSSYFCIHPEKLKQIIKEKDAVTLCNLFDSDEYKKKVAQVLEEQKEKMAQETPIGLGEKEVKYEHILSCAQPIHRQKADKPYDEEKIIAPVFNKRRKRPKKTTIMHLIRLPKTTPEGYRVLIYSVRDNDPTKMNFSDCVKGFCMYNDCILSEDGLQEGYVVVFDMKGVQIGHLARVSLPALRCFMLYIQEAHPCRLKSIHILNTASWIHHIMRLIVPLVKSELLNLVQFHKGNVPEGLPLELLPAEYGGEAPTIEELDSDTKSMVHKYHQWLLESAEFKSDESKREKKASWWGFFNGSNKTNNELDEKTILKNLQVD